MRRAFFDILAQRHATKATLRCRLVFHGALDTDFFAVRAIRPRLSRLAAQMTRTSGSPTMITRTLICLPPWFYVLSVDEFVSSSLYVISYSFRPLHKRGTYVL